MPLVFCYFLSSSSLFPQLAILVCLQRGRKVHCWDCFCLPLKLFYRLAFWSSKQLVSDVTPLPRLPVLGSESWEYFCHFDDLHVWIALDSPIVQSLLNLQGWEQVSVSKPPFTPQIYTHWRLDTRAELSKQQVYKSSCFWPIHWGSNPDPLPCFALESLRLVFLRLSTFVIMHSAWSWISLKATMMNFNSLSEPCPCWRKTGSGLEWYFRTCTPGPVPYHPMWSTRSEWT